MRVLGPDVVSVVGPAWDLSLVYFYLGFQFNILLSHILCFISYLYLDLYLPGDDTSIC